MTKILPSFLTIFFSGIMPITRRKTLDKERIDKKVFLGSEVSSGNILPGF